MKLSQIAYLSVRRTDCTDADIDSILNASRKNNGNLDITGVLLYSDRYFFQYLEGDEGEIMALYERIKGDPKHTNVILIAKAPIDQRVFPGWQMGAKSVGGDAIGFTKKVDQNTQEAFVHALSGLDLAGDRAIRLMKKVFSDTQSRGSDPRMSAFAA